MKAVRYYGTEDVRFEKIEKPSYKADEVLIKVVYAGICGSDLHIYRKGMFIQNIPETMGHEFVGIVEEVGEEVTEYKKGDAVTANPMVPCMQCLSCKKGQYNTCEALGFIGEVCQGCFAEYIVVKKQKVIPIQQEDIESAGNLKRFVLIEPLAVAINVMRRANFTHNDKIVVFGAGPIGCLVVALAKQIYDIGHITVVDLSEKRLEFAKMAGADICLTDGNKLQEDYTGSVDCAGVSQTVDMAVSHVSANGKLCIVSIFENPAVIDCNKIVEKQLCIIGCNVYTNEELHTACKILSQKNFEIEFLITNVFSPEECKKAFRILTENNKTEQKVIFQMNEM